MRMELASATSGSVTEPTEGKVRGASHALGVLAARRGTAGVTPVLEGGVANGATCVLYVVVKRLPRVRCYGSLDMQTHPVRPWMAVQGLDGLRPK
jgi:hypothetical protein